VSCEALNSPVYMCIFRKVVSVNTPDKQTMQQQNIQAKPVTQEDQQAMASAEAADPQSGAES
jgi:hypothetical protein